MFTRERGYVHVYVYVCVYVCVFVCIYVWGCLRGVTICMCVCMDAIVCMYACMYVCMYPCNRNPEVPICAPHCSRRCVQHAQTPSSICFRAGYRCIRVHTVLPTTLLDIIQQYACAHLRMFLQVRLHINVCTGCRAHTHIHTPLPP